MLRSIACSASVSLFAIGLTAASGLAAIEETSSSAPLRSEAVLEERLEGEPESAVRFGSVYKSEVMGPIRGTEEKGAGILGSLALEAELDFDALAGWKGGSSFVQLLANHQASDRAPSDYVGDVQVTSNIEAPRSMKLYQAWLKQSLLEDRFSLLAGLHDLNASFYVTDASAVFLNSSFGIGPEFGQSGQNGPSIFPTTSAAAIASARPIELLDVQLGAYGAKAGNPEEARGTHVSLGRQDGALLVGEVGLNSELNRQPGRIALGAWTYTRTFDHLTEVDADENPVQARSRGIYALVNQKLYSEIEGKEPGLVSFVRVGLGAEQVNAVGASFQAGLSYQAPFYREKDIAGIGVTRAFSGRSFRQAQETEGVSGLGSAETAIELTYRAQLLEWLAVQPDFQWVIAPGFSTERPDAAVAGARVELSI